MNTQKFITQFWIAFLLVVPSLFGQVEPSRDAEHDAGSIVGQIVDAHGEKLYVGRAVIFLCDAETGWPINRETKQIIQPTVGDIQIDKLWYAETNERGDFEFQIVRPGRYRLIAQSWSGTEGFKGFDPNLHPSAILFLHGVADDIEVRSGERSSAYLQQLGRHTLHITNDPEEEHALLLISLRPTLGDGILGPVGWGTEFRKNWIGVTQMEIPRVTICGLPDDASIHVGLMNYDNNPGVGAASYEPGTREGSLRIIASWSNGHKDPPPELVELVNYLQLNPPNARTWLDAAEIPDEPNDKNVRGMLISMLMADNERRVNIEGRGEERLADVLAAMGYVEMRNRNPPGRR